MHAGSAPVRLAPQDPMIPAVLALIRAEFAYMEGRIDPPSSMLALTEAAIARHCTEGEVWVLDAPPRACLFLSKRPQTLYLGKLAVQAQARGQGLARKLVDLAARRARQAGLPVLELETRIELTQNHAAFTRLGFVQTGTGRHAGYDRDTYLVFQKPV